MKHKEFFDKWIIQTSFSMELEIARLRLFMAITNNLGNEYFQKIINWEWKRETSYYYDNGYCELCADAIHFFLPDLDPDSSSAWHELCEFVSEAVLYIADKRKQDQIQLKQEEIGKLQDQIERLKKEVEEEK